MAEIATLGLKVDGTANIDSATQSLGRFSKSGQDAEKSANALSSESQKSSKSLADVSRESDRASRGVNGLAGAARRAAGVLATFLGTRELINYSNAWSDMTSLVRVNIGEQEDAAAVMSRLSDIARGTYSSLELTAQAFARNAFTLNALGASTKQQLDYTEALNNALVVSGARGQQAELVQNALGRAMAEGAVKGDDLNLVLNYGSRVAELLADELGVNVTQLRSLAREGQITGDVIFRSLVRNMEGLAEQAETMPATLADAFQLLRNSFLQMVGIFDQANGISESLAERIIDISDAIRDIDPGPQYNLITALSLTGGAVGALTIAYTGLTTAVWAANTAMTAFTRLMRVNPLVLAASAAVALGGALYTSRDRMIEIGETTGTIGDYLLGTWQEVTSRVQDYWGETVDSVIGWLDEMGVDAGSVASGIKDAFVTALDVVLGAHRLLFNTAVGIWYAQQTVVFGVAEAITTAFTTMGANASTVFTALWKDIQALLTLDFSTSHFTNAIENELISVAAAVGNSVAETAGKAAEQLTDDHLGRIVGNAKSYFDDLGTTIENRVATNQQIDSLTALSRRLLGMGREAQVTGENMTVLANAVDNTKDEVAKLTKEQRDAIRETEQLASAFRSLHDELNPIQAQQRQYQEDLDLLNNAHARAKELLDARLITEQEYNSILNERESLLAAVEARYRNSTQTAAGAYGGGGGFGAEIGSRGEAGSPTDPLARNEDEDYWTKWLESAETALTDFDSIAANTAENFQRGFGDAFESMIFDSQSLRESFYNLFDGIARSLVNALGQMAAQWLAYQAIQMTLGKASEAAAIGSATATGSAIAAAYAPAAAAASLASFGANAAPAIAGMAAAYAVSAAGGASGGLFSSSYGSSSAGNFAGFADGGWTGPGGKYDIAGFVHADEVVWSKSDVARAGGVAAVEALRKGIPGYANGGYTGRSSSYDRLNIPSRQSNQQAQAVAPVVNVIENPNRAGASEQRQDQDGKWVIDIFVANIQQGGKADKAIRANYGLSRQGV